MAFNFGELWALQQKAGEAKAAFAELNAAIAQADFASKSPTRFEEILAALDRIIGLLNFLKTIKSVPEASYMAEGGLTDVQALRSEVAAGKYASKEELQSRVDTLVAKYKAQLGPYGSMIE